MPTSQPAGSPSIAAADRSTVAPCLPTAQALAASDPVCLTQVSLPGGFWADRQQVNAKASIPLARERLEAAGNLHDLRLAAGIESVPAADAADASADTGFRGPRFADSDVYKSLEAAAWEAGRRDAPDAAELADWIDEVTTLLEQAQADDGYLNSYVQVVTHQRYATLEHSHEHYCAGHLLQAAVAAARATGESRLLAVAARLADHLVATFGPGRDQRLDGHPEIETALVELYRQTGRQDYLDLATHFVQARGHRSINGGVDSSYFTDALPADRADSLLGHAVRALYFDAGVVDVAVETHDRRLLAAVERRWEDMVASKTAITGGVGSRHSREAFGDRFELPPDRAYNESCAAIASIMLSWRLLLATGRARYAELIERTLFNSLAASVSADGRRFFYVNPLQRRHDHAEGDDPGRRHEWFTCACCPPNIMRVLASLGGYLATTGRGQERNRLYLHQFVSADIDTGGWDVRISAGLPLAGDVRVRVTAAPGRADGAAPAELAVRLPSWSAATSVAVNGTQVPVEPDEHGYLVLAREWQAGDEVALSFDLSPQLVVADPRVDALRGTAAVVTGPVVHCLESLDQPAGTDLACVAVAADAALRVEPQALPGLGVLPVVGFDAQACVPAVESATRLDRTWPYRPIAERAGADSSTSTGDSTDTVREVRMQTVPYFAWDNRDAGPMRVWIPLRSS